MTRSATLAPKLNEPVAAHIAIGLGLFFYFSLLVFAYAEQIGALISGWSNTTFHWPGFLVLPGSLVLGFLLRPRLRGLTIGPYIPGLLVISLTGAAWFISHAVGFGFAEQLCLIGLVGAGLLTLLGPNFCRAMIFPLSLLLAMALFTPDLPPFVAFALPNIVAAIIMGWLYFQPWRERALFILLGMALSLITGLILSHVTYLHTALFYGGATVILLATMLAVAKKWADRGMVDIQEQKFPPISLNPWTYRLLVATLILMAFPVFLSRLLGV